MSSSRVPSMELLRALRSSVTPSRSSTLSCQTRRLTSPSVLSSCRYVPRTAAFSTATPRRAQPDSPIPAPAPAPGPTEKPRVNKRAPVSRDRGPASEEDTQTDFGVMDIFSGTPEPATSVDACTPDGFHLNNGVKVTDAAVLLAGGESFAWKPWLALSPPDGPEPKIGDMLDARRGTLVIPEASLGILAHLYPKPDLLLLGTGSRTWALEPITRKYIMETLGIRIELMDTANATAAYNLLAKERGVEGGNSVAGCFLPIGWKGPVGAGRRR